MKDRLLLLVLLLVVWCQTVNGIGWSMTNATFPIRTAVVGATAGGGSVMLLGGRSPTDSEVWSSSGGSWTLVNTSAFGVTGRFGAASAVSPNGDVYVLGGNTVAATYLSHAI